MKKASFNGAVDYRFKDWGPAYLMTNDNFEMGIVQIRPGDALVNHYHEKCDETFIVIEGSCTLWINQDVEVPLTAGDIVSSEPNEQHHLRNDGSVTCRFIFIKTPASPGDTVAVPWEPTT